MSDIMFEYDTLACILTLGFMGILTLSGLRGIGDVIKERLQRKTRFLESLASSLMLEPVNGFATGSQMAGEVEGQRVVVTPTLIAGTGGAAFEVLEYAIVVKPSKALPVGITIECGTRGQALLLLDNNDTTDLITGDRAFDGRFVTRLPQAQRALAYFGHAVRTQLLEIRSGTLTFRYSSSGIQMTVWGERSHADVRRMIELAVCINQAFSDQNTKAGMLRIIREDPNPQVRINAIEIFQASQLSSFESTELFQELLQSSDWLIRLAAATALGPPGLERFVQLLETSPTPWPESLIEGMVKLDSPILIRPLRTLFVSSIPAVRLAGRLRDKGSTGQLLDAYPRVPSLEHRFAIVEVLADVADSAANTVLVESLQQAEAPIRLKQKVIEALGVRGQLAAIQSLHPYTSNSSEPRLRVAAARAIAAIQSRSNIGEAGFLSLSEADTAAGGLALVADDVAGELALADGDVALDERC